MGATSAGVLMYRRGPGGEIEVFLVHPGGPFFRNKDEGAWSIPKGLVGDGEEPAAAALRELKEETGLRPPGQLVELGSVRQKGGKTVLVWAVEHDPGPGLELRSNTFILEWPPRSGQRQEFPEVDRGEFFPLETARRRINPAQAELLERLAAALRWGAAGARGLPGGARYPVPPGALKRWPRPGPAPSWSCSPAGAARPWRFPR